ncbi:MAG: cyclic nucleotide-binding domain-containing protein [Alphaproteobacteria bacterium]|uniref:Cyclic nucleotide-binding domain-containing protein n=1 Tax=Candidatus Nitrobium versatile TaxID=2884831 RepID=A0A953SD53_9BACT|nr:cyclic nucleotide-binding domain-containing protein [Candidatus Nitrobium versatile]
MKKLEVEQEDILKLMRHIDFFNSFTEKELLLFVGQSEVEKFMPGEEIIREGDEGYSFYIILKGSVAISKKMHLSSYSKKINELSRGQCFGEMALVTGKSRSANVAAKEETFVIKLDPYLVNRETDDSGLLSVQLKIYKNLSRELAEKLGKHSEIITLLL